MTDYPLATLPGLPAEIIYKIFSESEPEEAARLCTTSSQFRVFCEERKLRITTMSNYYLHHGDLETSFLTVLKEGKNRLDVENLESILRLRPSWLNSFKIDEDNVPTLLLAVDPLIIAALLELGANAMLWYSNEDIRNNIDNYDQKFVKGGSIPLVYYLSNPRGISQIPLLCLCLRLGHISLELMETMILRGSYPGEFLYLPIDNSQVLTHLLYAASVGDVYLNTRYLLEMGADPLSSLPGKSKSILQEVVEESSRNIMQLMFHYTPINIAYLKASGTTFHLALDAENAAEEVTPSIVYSYPVLLYAYSQGRTSNWNNLSFWQKKWKHDLPGVPLPLIMDGEELRLAYRSEITKAVLSESSLGTKPDPRVGDEQELLGLGVMTLLLHERFEFKDLRAFEKVLGLFSTLYKKDTLYSQYITRNTVTSLPYRNYTAIFNKRKLQFDSLTFLEGAVKACRILGYDPQRYIRNVVGVIFD